MRVLDELAQDARFALRGLRRSPGFAALAILVLALAIAANTAIFALVDVLMLRPLGLREPDRLVRVFNKNTTEADAFRSFSYPNYLDLRDGARRVRGPGRVHREPGRPRSRRRHHAPRVRADRDRELLLDVRRYARDRAVVHAPRKRSRTRRSDRWSSATPSGRAPAPIPTAIGKPLEINGDDVHHRRRCPRTASAASPRCSRTDLWLPLGVYGTSVGQFMAGVARRPRRARSPRADGDRPCCAPASPRSRRWPRSRPPPPRLAARVPRPQPRLHDRARPAVALHAVDAADQRHRRSGRRRW